MSTINKEQCPKCGFTSENEHTGCPRCGLIYDKYEAYLEKKQSIEKEAPNKYFKKFIKYVLLIQAIGALLCILEKVSTANQFNVGLLIAALIGLLFAYLSFRKEIITPYLCLISFLVYSLVLYLNVFVVFKLGGEWPFGTLLFWNFLFGLLLLLFGILSRKVTLQALMIYIHKKLESLRNHSLSDFPGLISRVIPKVQKKPVQSGSKFRITNIKPLLYIFCGLLFFIVLLEISSNGPSSSKSSYPKITKVEDRNELQSSGAVPAHASEDALRMEPESEYQCMQLARGLTRYEDELRTALSSEDPIKLQKTVLDMQQYLLFIETRCPEHKKYTDKVRTVLNQIYDSGDSLIQAKRFNRKLDQMNKAYAARQYCRTVELGREILTTIPEMKQLYRGDESKLRDIFSTEKNVRAMVRLSYVSCRGKYY